MLFGLLFGTRETAAGSSTTLKLLGGEDGKEVFFISLEGGLSALKTRGPAGRREPEGLLCFR